jgi:hypothetical protein
MPALSHSCVGSPPNNQQALLPVRVMPSADVQSKAWSRQPDRLSRLEPSCRDRAANERTLTSTFAAERTTNETIASLQTVAELGARMLMRLADEVEDYASLLKRGPAQLELAQIVAHWRSKARFAGELCWLGDTTGRSGSREL